MLTAPCRLLLKLAKNAAAMKADFSTECRRLLQTRAMAQPAASSKESQRRPLQRCCPCFISPPFLARDCFSQGYRNHVNFTIGLTSDEKCEVHITRLITHTHDVCHKPTGSNSPQPQAGYLMGRFADGASTVADPYRVSVTPPVALRIARCVGLFMRSESKLGHWSSASRAGVTGATAGGVWRRLTVRCNNEGDVLVVMQASPAGAAGGAAQVAEEVSGFADS